MSTTIQDHAGRAEVVAMPPSSGGWSALVAHAESLDRDPLLAGLSDDQVVDELRRSAGAVASATARFLVLVGELVVRGLWNQGSGATTPAQWLSFAVGMAGSTAREQVRVALALRVFTATRDRFLAGKLSYSKVRAITRAGEPALEAQLLEFADNATAAQLEHIVRTFRGLEAASEDARPRRRLRSRDRGDGMTQITLVIPTDVGRRAEVLVERLVDELDASGQPQDAGPSGTADGDAPPATTALDPLSARRADALVHGLEVAVDHLDRDLTGTARTTLVLHGEIDSTIDQMACDGGVVSKQAARGRAAAGTGTDHADVTQSPVDDEACRHEQDPSADPEPGAEADPGVHETRDRTDACEGSRARPGTRVGTVVTVTDDNGRMLAMSRRILRLLTCDPSLCRITVADGLPIDVGDTRRAVPHTLRRALRHRDATCRFPGCAAIRHLHAHHIIHWADGGPTDLDNLILLCGAHHRFLHANDWIIVRTGPNRFAFHPPGSSRPHPNRLPAVGGGQADSAEAAARHDPRGLEPPGIVYPDYDLDLTMAILQDALDRLPVGRAA